MKRPLPERPLVRQQLPEEIVTDLLCIIRRQFVPDVDEKTWFKEHNQFIKRDVVLWPARFMVGKGFTVPAERYKAIMLEILNDIKRHGQTGAVRYWPGYLMKCVQEHWRHHWEDYYAEYKCASALVDASIIALKAARSNDGPDPIRAMAAAQRILSKAKRTPKTAVKEQLTLI